MNRTRWILVAGVFSATILAFVLYRATAAKGRASVRSESVANIGNSGSGTHEATPSVPIEISQRGPGMRPQGPDALKFPVPRTSDLTYVTAANFASALGDDPLRIFNYVRDEIAFESYVGCLRGPRGTLLALAGNSVDRASLLASMLQHAGQHVRFAHGTLPEPLARELVTSMWADRPQAKLEENSGEQPTVEAKTALDALLNGIKRDYTLIRDHVTPAATSQPSVTVDSLTKETQEHYWLQWFRNGTWVDLDPSFNDSSPGIKYAPATGTSDTLPDILFHHVQIRIKLEEYTGDHRSNRVILTRRFKAADLSGVDILLSHQPEQWSGPVTSIQEALASSIGAAGKTKPVLIIAEQEWVAGEPFYFKQPNMGGMGGVFNALAGIGTRNQAPIATAEWVEVDFITPTGAVNSVTRHIFDDVGSASRAAGKLLTAQQVTEKTSARGELSRNLYSLLFSTGRLQGSHFTNLADDPATQEDEDAPNIGMFLRRFNIVFTAVSDELLSHATNSGKTPVRFYQESPRLSIAESSGEPGKERLALDLRHDQARIAALVSRPEVTVPWDIFRGVADGTLESVFMNEVKTHTKLSGARGRTSLSTSEVFSQAQVNAVPLILLPKDKDKFDSAIPEDTKAKLQQEVSDGNLVFIPQRPIDIGGAKRIAWWRVNPNTGESVAVTDEGLNQVVVEYNAVRDRYGRGNVMVCREVWTDSAGNVVNGPTRAVNPDWLPGSDPKWAQIWRDFTQIMQGAVKNPYLRLP